MRFQTWHAACLDGTLSQTNACTNSRTLKKLMVLDAVCLILYFVWFIVIAATAWVELAHRPYKGFRMANQTLRMVIGLDAWPLFTIGARPCAQRCRAACSHLRHSACDDAPVARRLG